MRRVWVANSYPWPEGVAAAWAEQHGITVPPEGLFISTGIAVPVLIALGAAIVMTFIATRTRFGRYVFAMGGNPEAAELAGINTRWVTVKVFILMGALCGISAAIATARLNAATNALGTLDELYVIAAAVIGGTSLSGGVGTDRRRHDRRAGHAIAAVGHGADGPRQPAAVDRGRASFSCSRSGSTRSTAAAPNRKVDHAREARHRSSR